MNIFDFLEHLQSLDIHVSAENGKLRVNAPKEAITPEIRSELVARKDEILSVFSALDSIPLERRNGPLPLSLAQENLWQLQRLTPDTAAYTMYAVFRICGPLDIVALETAIHMVVARHESLRTSFPRSADGTSEQVIGPASTVILRQVTLASSGNAQEELQLIIEREIRLPFDLSTGPLFRPTLLKINDTEHVLIQVMHHIISDAHSFSILFDELEQAYLAASKGSEPAWIPLPLQYADYASWQRRWLATDASALDRNFWQSYLAGEVPALELPQDHPHPPQLAAEGDTVVLPIEAQMSAALDEFCRREGVTLFSIVFAAFNALLLRYSGQRDLLVCTPAAARDRSEFSRLVGYFNNTLLLRTDLSRINTWRELLQQVHNSVMNALAHQMFPFLEVAGFPNLARTPLSRAAVAVLDSIEKSFHLPGLQIEKITAFNKAVQYDLSLEVKVHSDGLVAQLMYRSALFERTKVERLIEEWAGILLEILADPGGTVVRDMDMSRTIVPARKTPAFIAPRSELEQRLAQTWQEVLQIDRVGVDDEFFELGGHSLLALRLFTRIEKETGTQLPLSTLFEKTTIASLARMIEAERTGASWDCLVPIQPKGDRPPVFLVHGIGGGVLGYRDLINAFGDDRPFLGLQAVGQDGREKYDLTIEAMASRYITVMRSHQPSGPYRIGGYCFGGLVAYEMASQLEKSGEQVSFLALFESALPDTMEFQISPLQRLGVIWQSLPVWLKDYSNMDSTQLLSRLRSTFVRVWAKVQRNPILKRKARVEETLGIDANDLPSRNIELTEIHMQAALQYRPSEYGGTVTLFRARHRSINDVVFGSLDASMGWRPCAKGGVQVCLVDGFHRNLHLLPYARSLAAELRKQLDIRDAAE